MAVAGHVVGVLEALRVVEGLETAARLGASVRSVHRPGTSAFRSVLVRWRVTSREAEAPLTTRQWRTGTRTVPWSRRHPTRWSAAGRRRNLAPISGGPG